MAHEQYLALGPLSLVASFERPMDASPLFRNPMQSKTARINHGLGVATARLYLDTPVVPWEILLPSIIRRLTPFPMSKLMFPKQSLFLSRIIKTDPTRTSGARM